jgi:hypothetical protein
VLNVAVAIAAGVGALTSAVPALHSHTLALCLAILGVLTLVNLRGTLEASRLWAILTYVFVASFLVLIGIGVANSIVTTAAALGVIVAAKFQDGAWITLLAIPAVLVLLHATRRYYTDPYFIGSGFDAAYDWSSRIGEWAWSGVFDRGGDSIPDLARLRAALLDTPWPGRVLRFLDDNDTGALRLSMPAHGALVLARRYSRIP